MKSAIPSCAQFRILALSSTLGAALLASCANPSGRSEIGALTSSSYQTHRLPRRIELLRTPREMREDYVHPPNHVSSIYRWRGGDAQWHLVLPSDLGAYAGFIFRKPYDFSQDRSSVKLMFKMKPAHAAKDLTVGLVDGDAHPPSVLVDTKLSNYSAQLGGGWAMFVITLDSFDVVGIPMSSALQSADQEKTPFDWSDVREFCLLSNGVSVPNQEITIRDVRIVR